MGTPPAPQRLRDRARWLGAGLLATWAAVSFGFFFFARDLQFRVGGWPFAYWMGAQGALVVFIVTVACYAAAMNRLQPPEDEPDPRFHA